MSGRSSSSRRCPSTGMQITPLVWRIMNAIASGVMASAAMMRSPSFSRSASSTTITSSPRAMAATAFSISVKGMSLPLMQGGWAEEAFDVLGQHVDFEIDGIAGLPVTQRGDGERVGDDRDVERGASFVGGSVFSGGVVVERGDGEADAVDGDRALLDHVAQHRCGRAEGHAGGPVGQRDPLAQRADAVDVALHQVPTEAVGQADRP